MLRERVEDYRKYFADFIESEARRGMVKPSYSIELNSTDYINALYDLSDYVKESGELPSDGFRCEYLGTKLDIRYNLLLDVI